MGRYIDPNKPLSDEDRAFLMSRAREDEVRTNDRIFGHLNQEDKDLIRNEVDEDNEEDKRHAAEEFKKLVEDEDSSFDEDLVQRVEQLVTRELRLELSALGEPVDGKKAELQDRLLNRLQDDRDAADV